MIEKIISSFPFFDRRFDFDSEELTSVELAGRTTQKVNELIDHYNEYDAVIAKKENSDDIASKRKLSASGNFTGTLLGKSIISVLSDITDALSLAKTIISMVNNRESIGSIYDGGNFVDGDSEKIAIEGGLF